VFDIYRIADYVKPQVLAGAVVCAALVGLYTRIPAGGGGVNLSVTEALSKRFAAGDVSQTPAAQRATAWSAKRLSDSITESTSSGTRTFVVYEDGTEVQLLINQGDPAGMALTITDRPKKEVRVIQTDTQGHPVFFQITHYDDDLQEMTAREFAANPNYLPFSVEQPAPMGMERAAAYGQAAQSRTLPRMTDSFIGSLRIALDDLGHFQAIAQKR
jgi:hypothetical protein